MNRLWIPMFALAACMLGAAPPGAPPAAPASPAAKAGAAVAGIPNDANAALDAARTLRAEVDALSALPPELLRDVRIAYRRIAFDLLFHGAAAPADAQAMAVAGLRLAAVRTGIDALLAREGTPEAGAAAVREALARFARSAEHGLEPLPPANRPEATLAPLLTPLREAVAILETRAPTPPSTAWPAIAEAPRAEAPADPAPRADADPAAADAQRAASIPGWIDAIGAARAQSRPAFAAAAQQWSAGLRDAQRRDAVRRAMDRFAREASAGAPGAFERSLRRGDPPAVAAAAGRTTDLVRELDARRGAWAQGWSNGRGSPEASRALLRAVRVAESLAAIAAAPVTDGRERSLGAWGGFALPDEAWSVHPRAAAARAALAVEALCAGNEAQVDAELAKLDIELPPVLFAGRMEALLRTWASGRHGIGAALAAAVDAPDAAAFLSSRRADLMLVARCMAEDVRAERLHLDDLRNAARAQSAERQWQVLAGIDPAAARLLMLRDLAAATAERPADTVPPARRR